MANYEMVMPYSAEQAAWLVEQGCAAPPAREGNRWPARAEVIAAVEAEGLLAVPGGPEDILVHPPDDAPEAVTAQLRQVIEVQFDSANAAQVTGQSSYLLRLSCRDWDRLGLDNIALFMHGQNWPLEVFLVHRLAQACGQLVIWPTAGDVPVVVAPDSDPGSLSELWLEAARRDDSWTWFYEQLGF
jgi:hypothetical protein